MMAETMGVLRLMAGSSPRRNLTSGVLSETLSGTFSAEEYPGTRRYSEKVWDSPSKNVAIWRLLSPRAAEGRWAGFILRAIVEQPGR